MIKRALLFLAFFKAFCSVAQTEQKAFFVYSPDTFYTRKFLAAQELYRLQKNHLPLTFDVSANTTCAFDGFGSNQMPEFLCTCNNLDAARTLGTQKLWPGGGFGYNLSGSGMNKLALWDGGAARATHQELSGRLMVMDSPSTLSAHTTAVAGNLIAFGYNSNVRGMSYETQLKNWNFSNDNAEIIGAAPALLLSNHSYASTTAWIYIGSNLYWYGDSSLNPLRDWKYGYYDNRSRIWDSVMYANPYYLMVKSAGNDRGNGVAPGTPHYYWNGSAWALTTTTRDTVGPYDCISTFGNAKNLLTVGAVAMLPGGYTGPASVSMLSYSSWGPTDDGRIKPDLVAASGNVYTLGSAHDSAYAFLGGTSMSAPNVTGSLLLLQQYFQTLKGRYMRNATLKALAIHTANRCKADPGPDYECGWGLPDMAKAAACIRDSSLNTIVEAELQNPDTFYTDVFCTAGDTLRLTLAWTDPHAIPVNAAYNDSTPRLINDLDIRVLNMAGAVIRMPFVLQPSQPNAAAGNGDNFRDNVEQIYWPSANGGRYRIRVSHKGTLQYGNTQKFSLLISGSPLYSATLPVGWLSGGVEQKDWNLVEVHWQTAWEKNNQFYVIEASQDGENFNAVGMVLPTAANQNKLSTYSFSFYNQKGFYDTWYFRIKQTDRDGKTTCSKVYSLETGSDWRIKAVYPNPFSDMLNIDVQCLQHQTHELTLYNLSGELVFQQSYIWNSGTQAIDLKSLANGMYILLIENKDNGRRDQRKVVKQN